MEELSQRWWSKDTVALVTGANKGIGLQLVREFARRGITTILTSRNEENGHNAMQQLQQEGLENVVFHQLDVTSPESVSTLAGWVAKTFGTIEILVNNAAITSSSFIEDAKTGSFILNKERVKLVFETNYYGAKRMTETFLPLIKSGGRIVNICSKAGDLNYLTNEWRNRLDDPSTLTTEVLDDFIEEFQIAALHGEIQAKGFSKIGAVFKFGAADYMSDYSTSKTVLNAYTRMIAPDAKNKKGVSINCMCPGVTSTEISAFTGHSVELGADTAVWLALLPSSDLPVGRFFMARKDVGFISQPLMVNGELIHDFAELKVNLGVSI